MTREEIAQAVFVFTHMDCTIITVKVEDKATQDSIYRTFDLATPFPATAVDHIKYWMDAVTISDYDNYLISILHGYKIPDDTDEADNWDEMLDDVRSRYRTRVERSK